MEGSGVGIAQCVVHVDAYGVSYVVGGCNVQCINTQHGRYDLSCLHAENWSA